jgi:hypothetical protein
MFEFKYDSSLPTLLYGINLLLSFDSMPLRKI